MLLCFEDTADGRPTPLILVESTAAYFPFPRESFGFSLHFDTIIATVSS